MFEFLHSNNVFFQVKVGYYIAIIILLLSFILHTAWSRESKRAKINVKRREAKKKAGVHIIPNLKKGWFDRIFERIQLPIVMSHYLLLLLSPIYCTIALLFSDFYIYHFILLSLLYAFVYYITFKQTGNDGGGMIYLPVVTVLIFAYPVSILLVVLKKLYYLLWETDIYQNIFPKVMRNIKLI